MSNQRDETAARLESRQTNENQWRDAFRQSEANFRNSLESSPLGVRIVTEQGDLLYANRAMLEIYGYSNAEKLRKTPVKERYTPESYRQHRERKRRRQLGLPVPPTYEVSIVRPDGEVRHLIASRKDVVWNGKNYFQVIYQDITGRKLAEQQLHDLSRRLFHVQEEERQNIARELHDGISQSLSMAKILVERAQKSDPAAAMVRLTDVHRLLQDVIADVREMSLRLHPSILHDFGLLPTLQWHFSRYTPQSGIEVDFEHSGLGVLDESTAIAVFRIVQEALSNAAKYAGVTRVMVRLSCSEGRLNLRVEDHGKGFDLTCIPLTSSGLRNMQERAYLLGGKLAIRTAPGEGTCITAEMPLEENRNGSGEAIIREELQ